MSDDALLNTYRYLHDHPEIFEAITSAAGDEFRVQKKLRSRFPDDAVRLALTVADLRRRAIRKFPLAERMWFDRPRLEQATPWDVAVHKARRFGGTIHDYCCGIGADAAALAGRGNVSAVDSDPLACELARWNAEVLGVSDRVTVRCDDVLQRPVPDGLLHVDPDRRATTQRAVRVEDYVPSVEMLREWMRSFAGGAVKVSPAANFGGKFDDVEIELVSLNGEAKEATIWFGELGEPDLWRATVLPAGATIAGDPLSVPPMLGGVGAYVYDPDPAVVRAGLIDLLCDAAGLFRLDDAEEYLTSDSLVETPFATAFHVLAELPNNERGLRKYLRSHPAGRLEIKARRLPVPVERLHRSLPTGDGPPRVILFARVAGKARILVTERV